MASSWSFFLALVQMLYSIFLKFAGESDIAESRRLRLVVQLTCLFWD